MLPFKKKQNTKKQKQTTTQSLWASYWGLANAMKLRFITRDKQLQS